MAPAIPPDDPGDHGLSSTGAGAAGLTDAELRATPVDVAVTGPPLATEATVSTVATMTTIIAGAIEPEDSAHTNGQYGIPAWSVRNDANAIFTSNDLDYNPISTDSAGRIKVAPVASFTHGQNTDIDSGANEQIVVASNPASNGVLVKAPIANTGTIYIGGSGVTTGNGYPLDPGENITIEIDNANKIYAIASVDNQTVAWVAA